MLKPELVKAVAKKVMITQADAERAIDYMMKLIAGSIQKEGRFAYPDFGVFTKVRREASSRPNPQDRAQTVHTPARNTVKFKPAPALKDLVKF